MVQTNLIPDELKALRAWLLRKGKKPFYANGSVRRANAPDDADMLVTFDEAEAALRRGDHDGLGIALRPEFGLVALDFDNCFDEQGNLDPRVKAAVEGTFCTISQSGRGLHAYFTGTVPRNGKDTTGSPAVEVFCTKGYLAETGTVWNDSGMWGVCPLSPEAVALIEDRFGPIAATDNTSWMRAVAPKQGLSLADAAEILKGEDPNCGYPEWNAVQMALHHEFDGSEEALELFVQWSEKAEKPASRREMAGHWRSFGNHSGPPKTMAGLVRKSFTPERVIASLRTKTKDEILSTWLGKTLHMTTDEANGVMREVAKFTDVKINDLKAARRDALDKRATARREASLRGRAGERRTIEHRPEDSVAQAHAVEELISDAAEGGSYLTYSEKRSEIVVKATPYAHLADDPDSAPPPVPQLSEIGPVGMRQRIEQVAVFTKTTNKGPAAIGVPTQIVDNLMHLPSLLAPMTTGLVLHPLVLRDGSILAKPGLHRASGLYLHGTALEDLRPYARAEAAQALQRIAASFLEGFEFATDRDRLVALAGLLTGVQRRVLDIAPGLAILANVQSSGKTTLARRIHLILTAHDMPVTPYVDNNEETQKRIAAILKTSPSLVCWDNISDGFTFRDPTIAAAMTTLILHLRILGVSEIVELLTNTLFVLTGNNLSLGVDEVSRWAVCRLQPMSARPEQRRFKVTDVVSHGRSIRDAVLRDAVGIVAGYLNSGQSYPTASRFPAWDRMVRQPLLWIGAGDVAEVFATNADESEEVQAHRAMLIALRDLFGSNKFSAAHVADATQGAGWGRQPFREDVDIAEMSGRLRASLEAMGCRDAKSPRSVGRVLKAKAERVAVVDDKPLKLLRPVVDRNGVSVFEVGA